MSGLSLSRYLLLASAVALLLASCSSGGSNEIGLRSPSRPAQLQQATPAAGLPPPSELLRSARGVGLIRGIAGVDFTSSQNVSVNGGALFSPDFAGNPGDDFSGMAYATYVGGLEGYEEDITLYSHWSDMQLAQEQAWVALGDFDRDCWRWFRLDAAGKVETGELERFVSTAEEQEGLVLIVVACTGIEPNSLHWLRLGENMPPQITVDCDNVAVTTGSSVAFTAQVTDFEDDIAGLPVDVDWDIAVDGTLEGENSLQFEGFFSDAGEYEVAGIATDSEGGESQDSRVIGVFSMQDFPLYAPSNVQASDGTFPSHVTITWEWAGDIEPESFMVLRIGAEVSLIESVPFADDWEATDLEPLADEQPTYFVLSYKDGYELLQVSGDVGYVGLAAPANVLASDGDTGHPAHVTISWSSPVEGALPEKYELQRAVGAAGPWSFLIETDSDVFTYNDVTAPGVHYWYRVLSKRTGYMNSEPGGPDEGWTPL